MKRNRLILLVAILCSCTTLLNAQSTLDEQSGGSKQQPSEAPKEKAEITEPDKGKVMTQKEYDVMLKEKMKEMQERFSNEREKSGGAGGGMHIRFN